ncbi:glycosyltransferase 61 family protein [Uliginosibacterium sp. H3]|uniref:Glycosyltransferase 61 family protein n=1 Tax=Uliginosibacterium silvisoli TaxID=3114758 RepID=A0ABU6K8I8_9RHOO|nr:glycosyltransferase 61 family protein [Uliginosibacterium sp. H3]
MMSRSSEQHPPLNAVAEHLYQESMALARQGKWQQALTPAQQAVALEPYNSAYHTQTGCAQFMLNDYPAATDSLVRAISLDANNISALNNLGYIYNLAACYKQAEPLLLRSVELDPNQMDPWLSLCYCAQNLDFREEEAVRYAMRAIELNPNNAIPYTYLSRSKLAQGDLPAALEAIQIAAHLEQGNPAYQYRAGMCLLQMERIAEAIDAFQAALALDPEHFDTLIALAGYFYKIEDFAAAEEACLLAEPRAPNKYPVRELLAKILFVTGRYDEAKQLFDDNRRAFFEMGKKDMPNSRTGWAPAQSIASWSENQALPLIPKFPEKVWQTEDVRVFGADPEGARAEPVTLPGAYVAEVENAVILPGHELILVDEERRALYDRLAFFKDFHALRPDEYVPLSSDTHVLFNAHELDEQPIEEGIFLLTEAMNNYAHWISEQLPRLHLIEDMPQYDGVPLLISKGLYKQQIEALQFIVGDRYPIRILDIKRSYTVNRLIYPSILTAYHKRQYRPDERATATDGALHPEAVHYLRERILPKINTSKTPKRRIWISRGKQLRKGQRRMLNEAELEALFVEKGFESIKPETMSFVEQVELFSEASMIAGPGGAAFMNMVFAPPGAKLLLLTKDHPQINFHYFTNIARMIGQEMAYVCGETVKNEGVQGFETDFFIDLDLVRDAMRQFLDI